jgi:hypothetical protein
MKTAAPGSRRVSFCHASFVQRQLAVASSFASRWYQPGSTAMPSLPVVLLLALTLNEAC